MATAGADAELLICDVDPEVTDQARDTLAVLRNRTEAAQPDKAESRG